MALRRKAKTRAVDHAYGVPVPEGLHEAIEIERENLSKADSLLGCLVTSMEYDDHSVNSPNYPDVAQLAREMVRRSINSLDSLVIQQRLLRNKIKEGSGLLCVDNVYAKLDSSYFSDTWRSPSKYSPSARSALAKSCAWVSR
jgi:hypothetical protein